MSPSIPSKRSSSKADLSTTLRPKQPQRQRRSSQHPTVQSPVVNKRTPNTESPILPKRNPNTRELAVLRQYLSKLEAKYATLERQNVDLMSQIDAYRMEIMRLWKRLKVMEGMLAAGQVGEDWIEMEWYVEEEDAGADADVDADENGDEYDMGQTTTTEESGDIDREEESGEEMEDVVDDLVHQFCSSGFEIGDEERYVWIE